MKKIQKITAIIIVLTMSLSSTIYAKEFKHSYTREKLQSKVERTEDKDKKYRDEDKDKKYREKEKDKHKDRKQNLEEKMYWKQRGKISKEVAKNLRKEIKARIKSTYLLKELEMLKKRIEEIQLQYKDLKILPVEAIISNKANFKFDMPPVIKGGRTLIPVRAITEGFGAEVEWNQEERKVIISKDGKKIELWIGLTEVKVDGKTIQLDTMPEIMNSRTVVPLRFIAETLNLKVEYHAEDETIEIIEEQPQTTTRSALTVENL